MSHLAMGIAAFPVLLALIFLRVPVGLAMLVVGLVGLGLVSDGTLVPLAKLKSEPFSTFSSYSLSIVPLFLLMGQFATVSGMSRALFKAAEAVWGQRRGGVAMASIGACAGFGAICGSSLATAATMGQAALPELRRCGYSDGFSAATLAAGGTLGILIPPSLVLVIYAILTEQNIAKLFAAALIPGLLAVLGYLLAVSVYVRLYPHAATTLPPATWLQRRQALLGVWPVLTLFVAVVGGIYFGVFTPTEGAAVGAAGTGLLAWWRGRLSRAALTECFLGTARATGMIFFIILGAGFFNGFLALTHVPQELAQFVITRDVSPWTVMTAMLVVYVLCGCIMDSLSMILLSVPIFFPVIMGLDFGMSPEHTAIWFGILVLIVVEVGLITPPVGFEPVCHQRHDAGDTLAAYLSRGAVLYRCRCGANHLIVDLSTNYYIAIMRGIG